MKYYHVKCRCVRAVENLTIKNATNGVRAHLYKCGSRMNQMKVSVPVTPKRIIQKNKIEED